MLSFLVIALLGIQTHASPQLVPIPASGGKPVGSGSGIPNVTDAQNPVCIPWYGIRDAIMGGLYQGGANNFATTFMY